MAAGLQGQHAGKSRSLLTNFFAQFMQVKVSVCIVLLNEQKKWLQVYRGNMQVKLGLCSNGCRFGVLTIVYTIRHAQDCFLHVRVSSLG